MEDRIYTENGKIKFPNYSLKLINSTNLEIDELALEDINSIKPVIDKNGKPGLLIEYYDTEFCYNAALFCDNIEINKDILII